MQEIFLYSERLIQAVETNFRRYLYEQINWDARLIEILGARGTGKTTLMLQRARALNEKAPNQAVYISLDDKLMYRNSIIDLAGELEKYGIQYLFLDEVHKYPSKIKGYDWSAEIKNVYDRYPNIRIVYSGSSVLKLYKGQGDLSRRKSSYRLAGLSFREYLEFSEIAVFVKFSLSDLLSDHQELARTISRKVKVIPHFMSYLKHGYYPFYKEDPELYHSRLNNILNVIIETDIPAVSEISFESAQKLKKLLAAIATKVPYVPNLLKLREELQITDQRTLLKYLDLLEKAEVISTLDQQAKGNKILHKPGKIYPGNTNYLYSLGLNAEQKGTLRETFFASQLSVGHTLRLPPQGDFLVDEKHVFEIGGKNKTGRQIRDLENATIVRDDIETGSFNHVPLWLFGFLY